MVFGLGGLFSNSVEGGAGSNLSAYKVLTPLGVNADGQMIVFGTDADGQNSTFTVPKDVWEAVPDRSNVISVSEMSPAGAAGLNRRIVEAGLQQLSPDALDIVLGENTAINQLEGTGGKFEYDQGFKGTDSQVIALLTSDDMLVELKKLEGRLIKGSTTFGDLDWTQKAIAGFEAVAALDGHRSGLVEALSSETTLELGINKVQIAVLQATVETPVPEGASVMVEAGMPGQSR